MPIKIHHGPPGSYKTAGAMGDDFLREAKAGRVIVTNVRGVSRERLLERFPELPDEFDVLHVDDRSPADRAKWATWFHWVPLGAFVFVDECQMIWPKTWKETDIRSLDFPGGLEAAQAAGRPATWEEAFEKHRHYNWDMVFTTPSYRKLRDDIRQCAEMAYKHKNLATIGIRGRYIEAMHLADDDGGSPSHFLSINQKKVPSYVFDLYDSTSTGQVTDTKTGLSIFRNPRILSLLVVLGLVLAFVLSRPVPAIIGGASPSSASAVAPSVKNVSPAGVTPVAVDRSSVPPGYDASNVITEPFAEGDAFIVMSYQVNGKWFYMVRFRGADIRSTDLLDMGYTVGILGGCGLSIRRYDFYRVITCGFEEGRNKQAQGEAQRSQEPVLFRLPPASPPLNLPETQPVSVTAGVTPPKPFIDLDA